jgi:hypothetical protein
VSRYNDVDPEEHRLLQKQLEEVKAELEKTVAAQQTEVSAPL